MKKILLSIGTVALTTVPIMTIVSCGTTTTPVSTIATSAETQKDMIVKKVQIKTALSMLTPTELNTPISVIKKLKLAMPEKKYLNVFDQIKTVVFIPETDTMKSKEIITLIAATTKPVVSAMIVTIEGVIPQKNAAALKVVFDKEPDKIYRALDNLMVIELNQKEHIIAAIKTIITDPSFTKAINAIVASKFTPVLGITPSSLVITLFPATTVAPITPAIQVTITGLIPQRDPTALNVEMLAEKADIATAFGLLNVTQLNQKDSIITSIKSVITYHLFNKAISGIVSVAFSASPTASVLIIKLSPTIEIRFSNLKFPQKDPTNLKIIMDAKSAEIVTALDTLTPTELITKTSVIPILKAVINDPLTTKAIAGIISIVLTTPSTLVIKLANAIESFPTELEVVVTITGLVPQKDFSALINEIQGKNLPALRNALSRLTSDELEDNIQVQTVIKSVITDTSYTKAISNIKASLYGNDTLSIDSLDPNLTTSFNIENLVPFSGATSEEEIIKTNLFYLSNEFLTELQKLTTLDLNQPSKIKTALKVVETDQEYQNTIESISSVLFVGDTLTINFPSGYFFTFSGIISQKDDARLKTTLDSHAAGALLAKLNTLTATKLNDISVIKTSITEFLLANLFGGVLDGPTYAKAISQIKNVSYVTSSQNILTITLGDDSTVIISNITPTI